MHPLQRSTTPHAVVLPEEPRAAEGLSAPARAEHERWMVRTAERTDSGAALERSIAGALALGGPGSRVALEAKALAGRGLKLGAAGKVEVEQADHGYRVVIMGGLGAKAGKHGGGWKAEAEQGLTTGRAWHFETREGAAWAASLLLQGLARDTPAALLLPADPALDDRLQSLDLRASGALLEFEAGSKLEGKKAMGGPTAEAVFTGAAKVELDRDAGELVVEQELKAGGTVGLRAFQLNDQWEVGPRADLGTVKATATWVQRWKLTPAQCEAAKRGELLPLARGLVPEQAHGGLKIALSGQVAGRGFEAVALQDSRSPGEAAGLLTPESLSRLPVRLAEVVPAHGASVELELGPVELEVEARVDPRRVHPGEARPLGEWMETLGAAARDAVAGRLRHSLAALAHGQ